MCDDAVSVILKRHASGFKDILDSAGFLKILSTVWINSVSNISRSEYENSLFSSSTYFCCAVGKMGLCGCEWPLSWPLLELQN